MVTLDGFRDQAKRVVAPIMLAAAVTAGSVGKVDAQQTTKPDSFVAASLAKPVSTSPKATVKTLDSVIANATKAGALKGPKDFTTKDQSGNQVEDSTAYEAYIAGLKERANKTSDPVGNLNALLSTTFRLKNNEILTESQSHQLIEFPNMESAIIVVGRLNNGLKESATPEYLRTRVDDIFLQELGINLKDSSRSLANIK
jgi:hypothetical protein